MTVAVAVLLGVNVLLAVKVAVAVGVKVLLAVKVAVAVGVGVANIKEVVKLSVKEVLA